jgi:hypothetical protein
MHMMSKYQVIIYINSLLTLCSYTELNLLFEPRNLNFDVFKVVSQDIERLFCSVAIYEQKQTFVKATETFNFEMMTNRNVRAVFKVRKHADLNQFYLLFRISRQFKGEYTDYLNDLYMKGEKAKDKDVLYLCSSSRQKYFTSVQHIQSPFAWAAASVQQALATSVATMPVHLLNNKPGGEMAPEQLLQIAIQNMLDFGTSTRKSKTIPGNFEFSLMELVRRNNGVPKEVDTLYNLILEKNSGEVVSAAEKCRLKSFKHDFVSLNNCMYINPLSFRSTNNDHKFIQVVVTFHKSDDNSPSLSCFSNPFSANPDLFTHEGSTHVIYKNKLPEFMDEIKCILPCTLTTRHHLVFHLYNVVHREKMLSKSPPSGREYIGYATLPIMINENTIIQDGDHVLDFYPDQKVPSGNYLSERPRVVVDKAFRVRIITSSLAYPDPSLSGLLSLVNREFTAHTSFAGIGEMVVKLPNSLHTIAPVLLTRMLYYLDKQTQKAKISEILDVIMKLLDRTRRESPNILLNYIKFHLNRGEFCHALLNAIRMCIVDESVDVDLWLPNFGLLFSILLKSMVLKVSQEQDRAFSLDFHSSVQQLSENVVLFLQRAMARKEITKTKTVNSIFSCFLRHLLSIMDRQFVITVSARYIHLVGDIDTIAVKNDSYRSLQTIVEMQLMFFEEFFSYGGYLDLFYPDGLPMDASSDLEQVDKHYVFSLYSDIVMKYLLNQSYSIRMRAIAFFRSFVVKFCLEDVNDSFITGLLMFEFVSKFLDKMNEWKDLGDHDRKKALDALNQSRKGLAQISNNIVSKKEHLAALKDLQKETTATIQMQQKIKGEIRTLEETKANMVASVGKYESEYQVSQERNSEERRQLLSCIAHILECTISNHRDELARFCTLDNENSTKLSLLLMALQLCLQAFEYEGATVLQQKFAKLHTKYFKSGESVVMMENTLSALARKSSLGTPTSRPRSGSTSGSSTPTKNRKGTLGQLHEILTGALNNIGGSGISNPPSENRYSNSSSVVISAPKQDYNKRKPSVQKPIPALNLNAATLKDKSEFIFDGIKSMQHLSERIGMLSLRILVLLVQQNQDTLATLVEEGNLNSFVENIVRTFLNFLYLNQSKYVLVTVLSYLRNFFARYRYLVLEEALCDYGMLFCEPLMRLCNSKFKSIRQHATSLLYLLIRFHYECNDDGIASCRVMTFLSLSRTLRYTVPVDNYMKEALIQIAAYGFSDTGLNDPVIRSPDSTENGVKALSDKMQQFAESLDMLMKDLQALLKDTMAISQYQNSKTDDPHEIEELYYRIAISYRNIPELTIEWMQQLIAYHKSVNHHAEAAQGYFQIIAIVFDILAQNNSKILRGLPIREFYRVTPNIIAPLQQARILSGPPKIPNSWEFSEEGIIFLLKSALDMLESAEQMESTLPVFKMLLPLFERNHMWSELALLSSGQMFNVYQRVDQYNQEKNQLFPLYYRIRFFGDKWPSGLVEKQFIYKMPKTYKLNVMTKYIKKTYGEDVHLLNYPGKVDQSTLDADKRYIQLTNVKPYIPPDEHDESGHDEASSDDLVSSSPSKRRGSLAFEIASRTRTEQDAPDFIYRSQSVSTYKSLSEFERNTNFKMFYYQTAFSKNAKKLSDKVTEVYKRRVIMTLGQHFPFVKTRLPVVTEEEHILSPIQAAIENIVEQNRKLEECLYYNPPDIPHLQMVLKGSVAVEVNSGPVEIVNSFLPESERTKHESKHIRKLNQKCFIFLQLCDIGVRVHSDYAGPEYRQFDITLRQKMHELKRAIQSQLIELTHSQIENMKQLTELQEFLKKNLAFSAASIFETVEDSSNADTSTSTVSSQDKFKRGSMRFSIPLNKLQSYNQSPNMKGGF